MCGRFGEIAGTILLHYTRVFFFFFLNHACLVRRPFYDQEQLEPVPDKMFIHQTMLFLGHCANDPFGKQLFSFTCRGVAKICRHFSAPTFYLILLSHNPSSFLFLPLHLLPFSVSFFSFFSWLAFVFLVMIIFHARRNCVTKRRPEK